MKNKPLFLFPVLLLLFFPKPSPALDSKTEQTMLGVLNHYLAIEDKLAKDTTVGIEIESQGIQKKVAEFFNQPCKPEDLSCAGVLQKISAAAAKMKGSDIASLRNAFQELSEAMVKYWTDFKPQWPDVFVFRCPMANENKGAPWLQKGSALKNPYFGKAMESCGVPVK